MAQLKRHGTFMCCMLSASLAAEQNAVLPTPAARCVSASVYAVHVCICVCCKHVYTVCLCACTSLCERAHMHLTRMCAQHAYTVYSTWSTRNKHNRRTRHSNFVVVCVNAPCGNASLCTACTSARIQAMRTSSGDVRWSHTLDREGRLSSRILHDRCTDAIATLEERCATRTVS
jgi:hypothetical protein